MPESRRKNSELELEQLTQGNDLLSQLLRQLRLTLPNAKLLKKLHDGNVMKIIGDARGLTELAFNLIKTGQVMAHETVVTLKEIFPEEDLGLRKQGNWIKIRLDTRDSVNKWN